MPPKAAKKPCAFFVKTGRCDYGQACKYTHDRPAEAHRHAPTSHRLENDNQVRIRTRDSNEMRESLIRCLMTADRDEALILRYFGDSSQDKGPDELRQLVLACSTAVTDERAAHSVSFQQVTLLLLHVFTQPRIRNSTQTSYHHQPTLTPTEEKNCYII